MRKAGSLWHPSVCPHHRHPFHRSGKGSRPHWALGRCQNPFRMFRDPSHPRLWWSSASHMFILLFLSFHWVQDFPAFVSGCMWILYWCWMCVSLAKSPSSLGLPESGLSSQSEDWRAESWGWAPCWDNCLVPFQCHSLVRCLVFFCLFVSLEDIFFFFWTFSSWYILNYHFSLECCGD